MIKVGVLFGGPSSEHHVSRASGETVLKHLPRHKYKAIPIHITETGEWRMYGVPVEPHEVSRHVAVCFNALHGAYGEDGKVQQLLESLHLPYTGSGPGVSALTMRKDAAKAIATRAGILTPRHLLATVPDLHADSLARYTERLAGDIHAKLSPPWVVKPVAGGSSIGTYIARTQGDLVAALMQSAGAGELLVEEAVIGREATVGTIDYFRGERIYATLPVEIRVPSDRFFDFDMKYSGEAQEIVPGAFSPAEKLALRHAALTLHRVLGIRDAARHDFIVTPRGVYFLETNTSPGMTAQSLLPKALAAGGASLSEFLDHVVGRALKR